MAIAIICPSCGHRAGAKEEWIGRQVKCPGCGERITVEPPDPPEPPTRQPPQQGPAPQRRPTVQRPQTQPRQATPQRAAPQRRRPVGRLSASGRQQARQTPRRPTAGYDDAMPDSFGGLPGDDPLDARLSGSPLGTRAGGAARKHSGSSKTLLIAAGVAGGLLLLVGVGLVASGIFSQRNPASAPTTVVGGAPVANLPAWSSDPALASQLGAEVFFDRYSLRLPAGYQPLALTAARAAPPGVQRQSWAWCDAPATDGTRHVIQAWLASVSDIPHVNSLDAEVNAYLENARADAASASYMPGATTKGQILGGPFARTTYSVTAQQATVHSVSYLGFDGDNRMLTLVSVSKEPEGTEAFKLLEASLLSLKRN